MGRGHSHNISPNDRNRTRLAVVLALTAAYMVAEVVGGLATNSLALLADAGHMLSDVAALGLSLFALWFARRPPTSRRTFGYYRAEILAALANGGTLVAVAIFVLVEAAHRVGAPPPVAGGPMMAIAAGGFAINMFGLWLLKDGTAESLNVRGAWLHILTDSLGSAGAVVAGSLIWMFGWNWADPTISVLIGLLVLYSAWALVRDAVGVLMEAAPGHVDVDAVRDAIAATPGVTEVYDLHVWSISSGLDALSAHVVTDGGVADGRVLTALRTMVHERFAIDHVTLQVEPHGLERHGTPF